MRHILAINPIPGKSPDNLEGTPSFTKRGKLGLDPTSKGEIESNKIVVGFFNKSLQTMHRSSRQNINKETLDLNKLNQTYRTYHPIAAEYRYTSF